MSGDLYASLDELQAQLDSTGVGVWSAADLGSLDLALRAASRWIDERLDTRFYAVEESRLYSARWPDLLYIDDLAALTSLKTDEDGDGLFETEWDSAQDLILEPVNAGARNRPYRQIRRRVNGSRSFPTHLENSVQVTGHFGYSLTPPDPIRRACLLLAQRLWMRKEAIFGIAGTPGLGVTIVQSQIQQDADVVELLRGIEIRHV